MARTFRRKRTLSRRYRRRFKRALTKKSVVRMMKTVALRKSETKWNYVQSALGMTLYHNNQNGSTDYMLINNLLASAQGVGQNYRVGDEIIGRYLLVKVAIANLIPSATYRVYIYSHDANKTNSAAVADLFHYGVATESRMIAKFNSKNYTLIKQKFLKPLPTDYSVEVDSGQHQPVQTLVFKIPLNNRRIVYNGFSSVTPKAERDMLSLGITAYAQHGTSSAQVVGGATIASTFYYKDP